MLLLQGSLLFPEHQNRFGFAHTLIITYPLPQILHRFLLLISEVLTTSREQDKFLSKLGGGHGGTLQGHCPIFPDFLSPAGRPHSVKPSTNSSLEPERSFTRRSAKSWAWLSQALFRIMVQMLLRLPVTARDVACIL